MASIAGRSRSSCRLQNRWWCSKWVIGIVVRWCVGDTGGLCALIGSRVFVLIPILASLGIARCGPAHPDIATNAYTTALLGDSPAKCSAFGQTGELLRTVHYQDFGLDLEAVGDVSLAR